MYDIFGLKRMREIVDKLDGLKGPCDADLNVDGRKNAPTPHIVIEVDTSKISELVCEAQECIDRAVEDIGDHFTDGGMSKEPIKIPDIKFGMFVSKLKQNARNRTGMYRNVQVDWRDKITSGKHVTQCTVSINAALVGVGIATKHKDDIENEYIGKSLSFNRAFDKLEKAVLKVKVNHKYGLMASVYQSEHNICGIALEDIRDGVYGKVFIEGNLHLCIAGADIDKHDKICGDHDGRVYPTNSKQKGYRGGRCSVIDFENAYGCIPPESNIKRDDILNHVFIDGVWRWIKAESDTNPKTKSESVPNLTPIHDDITITMSRKDAEEMYKKLQSTNEHNKFFWTLFHAMK